nr:hypothetical protein [uncultured Desulfuromonas sp.]
MNVLKDMISTMDKIINRIALLFMQNNQKYIEKNAENEKLNCEIKSDIRKLNIEYRRLSKMSKQQMAVDEINELTDFLTGGARRELDGIRKDLDRYKSDLAYQKTRNYARSVLMLHQIQMIEGQQDH